MSLGIMISPFRNSKRKFMKGIIARGLWTSVAVSPIFLIFLVYYYGEILTDNISADNRLMKLKKVLKSGSLPFLLWVFTLIDTWILVEGIYHSNFHHYLPLTLSFQPLHSGTTAIQTIPALVTITTSIILFIIAYYTPALLKVWMSSGDFRSKDVIEVTKLDRYLESTFYIFLLQVGLILVYIYLATMIITSNSLINIFTIILVGLFVIVHPYIDLVSQEVFDFYVDYSSLTD